MGENKKLWIGIGVIVGALLLLVTCACCIVGGVAVWFYARPTPYTPTPPPILLPITPVSPVTPVSPDLPPTISAPLPDEA